MLATLLVVCLSPYLLNIGHVWQVGAFREELTASTLCSSLSVCRARHGKLFFIRGHHGNRLHLSCVVLHALFQVSVGDTFAAGPSCTTWRKSWQTLGASWLMPHRRWRTCRLSCPRRKLPCTMWGSNSKSQRTQAWKDAGAACIFSTLLLQCEPFEL